MTDEELKQLVASLAVAQKQTDTIDELFDGIYQKTDDEIAEEFFFQSFIKNPTLGNIKFDSVSRNLNNHIGDLQDEYDLVLINGDSLAVIEVKAHVNDLEKMITKKIVNFPKLFKIYKDFHLYAGVATLVTNDALIAKAKELGLFLLTQQGDHTAIVQTGRLLH
jgi:Holliday junction resolvase-like predicted endonuclease